MAGCSGMDSQISVPMATIFAVVRAVSKRRRAKACPLWCWMTCESEEATKKRQDKRVTTHPGTTKENNDRNRERSRRTREAHRQRVTPTGRPSQSPAVARAAEQAASCMHNAGWPESQDARWCQELVRRCKSLAGACLSTGVVMTLLRCAVPCCARSSLLHRPQQQGRRFAENHNADRSFRPRNPICNFPYTGMPRTDRVTTSPTNGTEPLAWL